MDAIHCPGVTELRPAGDGSIHSWQALIDAVGPASLLVVINLRMGTALKGKTSAEDILQDVLLEAWRSRGSLDWRGLPAFRSLLLTMIDRRIADVADHFAALKRGGPGIAGGALKAPALDGPTEALITTTPSRLAVYREQAAAMLEALRVVPEEWREVVRLRLFEELSSAEIGVRLGLGESGVRHRLRRGSEVYRRALERLFSTDCAARVRGIAGDSAPVGG